MKRLRWKKHEKATGLAAVGAGPRGSDFWDGEKIYASVYCHSTRHTGKTGWYWVAAQHGVPWKNTCNDPGLTEEDAKKQASEFIKKHFKGLK